MTIKPKDDLTVTIPSNEMSRQEVLEMYVQRLQAQGRDTSHIDWGDLEAAARPLAEAHQRDELSLRQIADQLGLDLVSTSFLFSEMFGRGKWVKVRFHTPGQHTS